MWYGTILAWGLFMYSGFVHEGDHVSAVRYCFNLVQTMQNQKKN